MKRYKAVITTSLKRTLEHRSNMLFGNLQSVFTLFILFFFWKKVYEGYHIINGYTFEQIVTHYFLMRVIYNRVSAFYASSLAKDIKTGAITKVLVKPVDFIHFSLSQEYIVELIWTVGNLVSILIFAGFLYTTLVLPTSTVQFGFFIIVFLLNGLLSTFINMLIGFLGFWTTEISHLKLVTTQVISILSGALIPISYFPKQVQDVLNILPFKYLVQFPIDVYLGRVPQHDIYFNLVILLGWVVALFFFARFTLNLGLKSYESFN